MYKNTKTVPHPIVGDQIGEDQIRRVTVAFDQTPKFDQMGGGIGYGGAINDTVEFRSIEKPTATILTRHQPPSEGTFSKLVWLVTPPK